MDQSIKKKELGKKTLKLIEKAFTKVKSVTTIDKIECDLTSKKHHPYLKNSHEKSPNL